MSLLLWTWATQPAHSTVVNGDSTSYSCIAAVNLHPKDTLVRRTIQYDFSYRLSFFLPTVKATVNRVLRFPLNMILIKTIMKIYTGWKKTKFIIGSPSLCPFSIRPNLEKCSLKYVIAEWGANTPPYIIMHIWVSHYFIKYSAVMLFTALIVIIISRHNIRLLYKYIHCGGAISKSRGWDLCRPFFLAPSNV